MLSAMIIYDVSYHTLCLHQWKSTRSKHRSIRAQPNTDGIHLSSSTGITILNSKISTGDDCISIGPGNSSVWIEKVVCGPGHGIRYSKWSEDKDMGSTKQWVCEKYLFQRRNVTMVKVKYPIIIDGKYCPNNGNCPNDQVSGVKISNVVYENVHETSATQVAVKFDCSKGSPCSRIRLKDVSLVYVRKPAVSSCSYAAGTASGLLLPTSCL
ncbi:polygalacturonase-like protein [Tanacetum coccineum]